MNLDESAKRVYSWLKGKRSPPQMVQIYPTNACNLKCIFCVQALGIYDLKNTVPKKRWLKIVNEICNMGVEETLISGGGEPLCTPNLTLSMMKVIKKHRIEGRIITNGTLWNRKSIEKTVRISWDHVIFSLDAPDAITHDYLRGKKNVFRMVIKNIKTFNEIKKKFGSRYPMLEFTCVLNVYNFKKVPQLIELAHSLGIENVNVEPVCANNPVAEKIKLNTYERKFFLENVLPEAEKFAKEYNISTNFSKLKEIKIIENTGKLRKFLVKPSKVSAGNSPSIPCYEPWLWPKIEANGEVWPCSTVSLKENIKQKSFGEIWFGEKFEEFRARILKKDLPEECNNCVLTHVWMNKLLQKKLEFLRG